MKFQVEIMDIKTYYGPVKAEPIELKTRDYDIVHKLDSKDCNNRDKVASEIGDLIFALKKSVKDYAEFFSTSAYFLENHFYNIKVKNVNLKR
ncbi:MAG: hypothetical protein AB1480_08560 [Nitrospirota bacterium]